MTEPIIVTFTPNERDYSSTLQAFSFRRKQTWVIIGVWVLITLYFGKTLVDGVWHDTSFGWTLLLGSAVFIAIFLSAPFRTAKQIMSNKSFTIPITWQIDASEIIVKNSESESKFSWNKFAKVDELPDYYLFIYASNPRMYQFLPKRAFVSPAQQADFHHLIRQQGKISK